MLACLSFLFKATSVLGLSNHDRMSASSVAARKNVSEYFSCIWFGNSFAFASFALMFHFEIKSPQPFSHFDFWTCGFLFASSRCAANCFCFSAFWHQFAIFAPGMVDFMDSGYISDMDSSDGPCPEELLPKRRRLRKKQPVPASEHGSDHEQPGPRVGVRTRSSHMASELCGMEPREYRAGKRAKLPNWFPIGLAVFNLIIIGDGGIKRDSGGLDIFGGEKGYTKSMSEREQKVLPFEILDGGIFQDINSPNGFSTLMLHCWRCEKGSTSLIGIVCSTWFLKNYNIDLFCWLLGDLFSASST